MADTGSDRSILSAGDGSTLGLDYSRLTGARPTLGIGGSMETFVEDAVVAFHEPGVATYLYAIELAIAPPDPTILALPSLLGRDVFDRWRMVYDPTFATLDFDVHSAEVRMPLSRTLPPEQHLLE